MHRWVSDGDSETRGVLRCERRQLARVQDQRCHWIRQELRRDEATAKEAVPPRCHCEPGPWVLRHSSVSWQIPVDAKYPIQYYNLPNVEARCSNPTVSGKYTSTMHSLEINTLTPLPRCQQPKDHQCHAGVPWSSPNARMGNPRLVRTNGRSDPKVAGGPQSSLHIHGLSCFSGKWRRTSHSGQRMVSRIPTYGDIEPTLRE